MLAFHLMELCRLKLMDLFKAIILITLTSDQSFCSLSIFGLPSPKLRQFTEVFFCGFIKIALNLLSNAKRFKY